MALYGDPIDMSLFRSLAREVVNAVVSTEIGYYKFALKNSKTNSYGESKGKFYFPPVLLTCLVQRTDQTTVDDEKGPDTVQTYQFRFLRDDMVVINLVPEKGDIIMYRNLYWEIDNIIENQFLFGKINDYSLSNATAGQGESWSILCDAHHTRTAKINITKDRL